MKHLYVHSPRVIASGQVDDSFDEVYPTAYIPTKNVTGFFDLEVKEGYTVIFGSAPGLDDLGRQRIRRLFAHDLLIGYSSQGVHWGEVNVAPNNYWSILELREVWNKPQYFLRSTVGEETTVTIYKDFELHFPSYGAGILFYPKANAGPARAGLIDPGTGFLRISFEGFGIGMPVGEVSVVGWLWGFGDGVVVTGTVNDANVTVDFPPGFRYVSFTVTDTNGLSHTMYVPVLADDPNNSLCVENWQEENIRIGQEGQSVEFSIFSDLPYGQYPDGTLVLYWDDEEPDHIPEFHGWHHQDDASLQFVRTGYLRDTRLSCVDIAGKMDTLPAQDQVVENEVIYDITVTADAAISATTVFVTPLPITLPDNAVLIVNSGPDTITVSALVNEGAESISVDALTVALSINDILHYTAPPQSWMQMREPDMGLWLDYLIRWHSNVYDLADHTSVSISLPFIVRTAGASTLWQQVQEQARSAVPDYLFLCNRKGQLLLLPDRQLFPVFGRPSTILANLTGLIQDVKFVHQRQPRIGWIRGGAVLATHDYTATTTEVEYTIRPSETSVIGATSLAVNSLPVTVLSGAILYLRGLDDQLIPWFTTTGQANKGATSISIVAATEIVFPWDELSYTATVAGPDLIPTAFCLAPGLTPGLGAQQMTINNKLAISAISLAETIGHLYARLNAEFAVFQVELGGGSDLGIDPAGNGWVTAVIEARHIPQRGLPFFSVGTRFLVQEVSKSFSHSAQGRLVRVNLTLERETSGIPAVIVDGSEVV